VERTQEGVFLVSSTDKTKREKVFIAR